METVLISLSKNDLQQLITDAIYSCLRKMPLPKLPPVELLWLSIEDLNKYLPERPSKGTILNLIATNSIPYHNTGKKVHFLKNEIDAWLKLGRPNLVGKPLFYIQNQKINDGEVVSNG